MGTRARSRRIRRPDHIASASGMPPGLVASAATSPAKANLEVFSFGPEDFEERRTQSADEAHSLRGRRRVLWINMDGVSDAATIVRLGELFGLHRLALEDVHHPCQRPKADAYDGNLFIVVWMLHDTDGVISREQVGLFVGDNFVLTFQEGTAPGDAMDPIRKRIREDLGRVRRAGADYLAYALTDAIVDSYFPILERRGERLDELENDVFDDPSPAVLHELHRIRHDLQSLRRAIWPLRGVVDALAQGPRSLVAAETIPYLRDCNDHVLRLMDLLESDRELSASLMDVYLSTLSLRMNEVMKVLAIISTIFMPLSFIAGLYGMNFEHMPELSTAWGYPVALAVMAATAIALMGYFHRKGWIGREPGRRRARKDDPA